MQAEFNELLKLVTDMRKAQKDYFKLRGQDRLIASKKEEAKVDEFLEKHKPKSPKLF